MAIAERNLITNVIRSASQPIEGNARDYDKLLKLIHKARFCLLGEATHGTHEFYRERSEITKRLIKEKGFTAIAVEADWPDAFRVNRYVRGMSDDRNADEALGGFKRFPTWMWRNPVVLDFVEWLRDYNSSPSIGATKVGLYGLDFYSLYTSKSLLRCALVGSVRRRNSFRRDARIEPLERYALSESGEPPETFPFGV